MELKNRDGDGYTVTQVMKKNNNIVLLLESHKTPGSHSQAIIKGDERLVDLTKDFFDINDLILHASAWSQALADEIINIGGENEEIQDIETLR